MGTALKVFPQIPRSFGVEASRKLEKGTRIARKILKGVVGECKVLNMKRNAGRQNIVRDGGEGRHKRGDRRSVLVPRAPPKPPGGLAKVVENQNGG